MASRSATSSRRIALFCTSVLFVILLAEVPFAESKIYKICATTRKDQGYRCNNLNRGNTEVNCQMVVDSAECALRLRDGTADFAVFSGEEAILASRFINEHARVIAEVRHRERLTEPFAFQAVAVVRSDFSGLLTNLKGKNYCHPGFTESKAWTDRVLKHFERTVANQYCDRGRPYIEDEVANVASFFNASCRPGKWVLNEYMDKKLKKKYPELCALCDHKEACLNNQERVGSHEAALDCLTKGGGDVSYVALQYVQEYFGLTTGRLDKIDPRVERYRFLCPDGSTQLLTSKEPCSWIRQPWGAIVARTDSATEIKKKLKSWIPDTASRSADAWQDSLAAIVLNGDENKLKEMPTDWITMRSYLEKSRNDTLDGPPNQPVCRPSIRWCVISDAEEENCAWLREGAYSYGMQPVLECVRSRDMWDCMAGIKNGSVDIVAIDTDYSNIARQTYDLTPLLYQETTKDSGYSILAVVREDSNVFKLADLKKKSACFPEYGGLAWTAWVDTARAMKLLPRKCPSNVAVSEYFFKICAPGADDPLHNKEGSGKTSLCSLCTGNSEKGRCGTALNNTFFGDYGALTRCLGGGHGDVAFIDLRTISSEHTEKSLKLVASVQSDKFRVLCRNGSTARLADMTMDSACALANGIGGEVLVRDLKDPASADAAYLLLSMESWFGHGARNYESAINMFADFYFNKSALSAVLFKRHVVGFVSIYDKEHTQASEFANLLLRNKDNCNLNGTGGASSVSATGLVLLVTALAAVLNYISAANHYRSLH